MARVFSEQEEKRIEAIQNLNYVAKMERKVEKAIEHIEERHKIDLFHKIKTNIFKQECEVCQFLKELK